MLLELRRKFLEFCGVVFELGLAARAESELFWSFGWRLFIAVWGFRVSFSAAGVYLEFTLTVFRVLRRFEFILSFFSLSEFWFGCILGWSCFGTCLAFCWS